MVLGAECVRAEQYAEPRPSAGPNPGAGADLGLHAVPAPAEERAEQLRIGNIY